MPPLPHRVWTPIGNAWDAYRRRHLAEHSAFYEHLWRLIHIHESVTVMLGSALATRLLTSSPEEGISEETKNDLRSMLTGIKATAEGELVSPNTESACLGGSVGTWLDLLNRFGLRDDCQKSPFRTALREYLGASPDRPLRFIEDWRRIGPVPATYQESGLNRIGRFQAINSLRNKLAHVPISERTLRSLLAGLRFEVLSALTPDNFDPDPSADARTTNWYPPLRGTIACPGVLLYGTSEVVKQEVRIATQPGDVRLLWGAADPSGAQPAEEHWSAAPFVRVDGELKVGILFRLPGVKDAPAEGLTGAYHRFAAEIEPVREELVASSFVQQLLPRVVPTAIAVTKSARPTVSVAKAESAERPISSAYMLRSEAEAAFGRRDFKTADEVFTTLAAANDSREYNDVAKFKHGIAKRRLAQDLPEGVQRSHAIDSSITLLEQAAKHRDLTYQAKARYELSRALAQKYSYGEEKVPRLRERAIEEAKQAAKLVYAPEYINWAERIAQVL